jgi:predicted molibdopterin-dependent oxidoreductase YjgC
VQVARKADPDRAARAFPWRDTQDIRAEIDRVCPTYRGIAALKKKGDNFQYGGARLLEDRFLTADGKGHFSALDLPESRVPEGKFVLSTRRGKQFNSMVYGKRDPQNGAGRDAILISAEDAASIGVANGDSILLQSEIGEFRGRARIDRIKPGSLQGYWPEVNVLIPSGCLDSSGVPDYNAIVEVVLESNVVPVKA